MSPSRAVCSLTRDDFWKKRRIKGKKKREETEYAIKTEHIFDKHTAKEKDRQTELCRSAAL